MSKEIEILKKYKKPVINALDKLKQQRRISKVCRETLNNMNPSRITEIISGHRELTPYYLGKFIQAGIVDIDQILAGKDFTSLPKEEQILLQRLMIDDQTIGLLLDVKRKGIDVVQALRNLALKAD